LPDRLLLAWRTGCCRTTFAEGASGSGSGSCFVLPIRSNPRTPAPFCPFAGPDAAAAASPEADPVRTCPDPLVAPPEPGAALGRDPGEAPAEPGRPLPAPALAPPAAGFAGAALALAPDAGFAAPPALALPAPPWAALAAPPDAADRGELGAGLAAGAADLVADADGLAAGAVAPAGCTLSTLQFRNMKYCWPSVHRFVVTQ
jgi:hypothetical protein